MEKRYGKLAGFIPLDVMSSLRNRAEKVLDDLNTRYFPAMDKNEFCGIYGQSVPTKLSRCAAYRFLTENVRDQLMAYLVPAARDFWGPGDYKFFSIFYLRMTRSEQSSRHYDSQPHYDRSYCAYAYTFWIPPEKIDARTGGICVFPDASAEIFIKQQYELGKCNDYTSYSHNHEDIDHGTADYCIFNHLIPGDVFTFDSNVLYGALKGSNRRLSLDVRLFLKKDNQGNHKNCDLVSEYEHSHDQFNSFNLHAMGDETEPQKAIGRPGDQGRHLMSGHPWREECAWRDTK